MFSSVLSSNHYFRNIVLLSRSVRGKLTVA